LKSLEKKNQKERVEVDKKLRSLKIDGEDLNRSQMKGYSYQ